MSSISGIEAGLKVWLLQIGPASLQGSDLRPGSKPVGALCYVLSLEFWVVRNVDPTHAHSAHEWGTRDGEWATRPVRKAG